MAGSLLKVEDLTVAFTTDEGHFNAVEKLGVDIPMSKVVGLVGESGCGKSVTALSIMRLIPSPPAKVNSGRIVFKGKDLLRLTSREMQRIRGDDISMIFQEPQAALSPLQRIGRQMVEAIQLHRSMSDKTAWQLSGEWLAKVGIPDAGQKLYAYPYQLSGGMQQRIMIAMALMLEPELLIADEPTTALDVTIQAQIFQIIRRMKRQRMSILLITHDMGVVWEMCDLVLVMYAAKVVEEARVDTLFSAPAHPYTQGLLKSIPRLSVAGESGLSAIPGSVPSPLEYPKGCRFQARCPHVFERCREADPALAAIADGHRAACFIADRLLNSQTEVRRS